MKNTLIRLAIASCMLALLTACGTAPRDAGPGAVASPPVATATRPGAARSSVAPASATVAGSPAEMPADEAAPNLLGGEMPKEYQRGGASWYGPRFHGRRTASGERYDMHDLTAAHRTLPFGTLVRVRSLVNGHEVDVRITDRGPFSRNRIIDVSHAAAEELGMLGLGIKNVVLLVPESTPDFVEPPRRPAVPKPPRSQRRQ